METSINHHYMPCYVIQVSLSQQNADCSEYEITRQLVCCSQSSDDFKILCSYPVFPMTSTDVFCIPLWIWENFFPAGTACPAGMRANPVLLFLWQSAQSALLSLPCPVHFHRPRQPNIASKAWCIPPANRWFWFLFSLYVVAISTVYCSVHR